MRTYKCVHTGKQYNCTYDSNTGKHSFTDTENGEELNNYLACAFTGIQYRFSDKSIITLNAGELINLHLCVSKPTHKKYIGFGRFTKIK